MNQSDVRYVSRVYLTVFVVSTTVAIGAALWLAMISINPMHDPTFWQPHAVVYHRV